MREDALFLSYNRTDYESVRTVQQFLRDHGIATFLDREDLAIGEPWPQQLERALATASGAVVFIGPQGFGAWQKREIGFALDRQVNEEKEERVFPVIPVLLPGSSPTAGFLFLNSWVDLRETLTDPVQLGSLVTALKASPRPAGELVTNVCPYRGLRAFQEEDAAFFFGRKEFAERLLTLTLKRNVVALIGPSGSGKSSVAHAGLIPLLRRQRPPSTSWDIVSFTPGDRPFHRLAACLLSLLESESNETTRLHDAKKLGDSLKQEQILLEDVIERVLIKSKGTDRLLLLADQFEETFTLGPESDRGPFVKALLRAVNQVPLTIVFNLRADFYGHAISLSREFSDYIENGLINLGPMTLEEMEQVVEAPARKVGLKFEPGLANRILEDVRHEPGCLPLLEFVLAALWENRYRDRILHESYQGMGRVQGAIARIADQKLAALTPLEQETARRVFMQLIQVGDGTADSRRRAKLNEFGNIARTVIKKLTDARLIVTNRDRLTDEDTVEVGHEALIRYWPRLQAWASEDRDFLYWRQQLRARIAEWEQTGHDPGALLRGAPLARAERWLRERPYDLSSEEQNYIANSEVVAGQGQDLALQARRERLASLGSFTTGLVNEIRNPIVAIRTFTQLLPERAHDKEFIQGFQGLALKEIDRIAGLINDLLTFARPSKPTMVQEDLNDVANGTSRILEDEAKARNIDIRRDLGLNLPHVWIDREQMKQVFMNLVLNAIQAMKAGGSIYITTRPYSNDERGQPASFVQAEIRDTGVGIPEDSLEHIFDPFFASNDEEGMGLGLSISHSIVQEHGGYIEVVSTLGQGTSFRVNLPVK